MLQVVPRFYILIEIENVLWIHSQGAGRVNTDLLGKVTVYFLFFRLGIDYLVSRIIPFSPREI